MDTTANKQLLQDIYAQISRGNLQPLLDSMADDIQWTIIGSTAVSGTSRRQAGGDRQAPEAGARPVGRPRWPIVFQPERFIAEGEYVVMQAKGRATALSGKPYNNIYCIVCRIVDGKVKEMVDYVDTELITSALGA